MGFDAQFSFSMPRVNMSLGRHAENVAFINIGAIRGKKT
jgi:hypothetical protein